MVFLRLGINFVNNILKQTVFAFFIMLLLSVSLLAKVYESIIVDEVTSIYDGDTFTVNIKKYPQIIGEHISVRVNAVDTPELRAKCEEEKQLAQKAKLFTTTMLKGAKQIELRDTQRGKYFRIVADVYIDGKNLGEQLIENNLAVMYSGGTKTKDWCKK